MNASIFLGRCAEATFDSQLFIRTLRIARNHAMQRHTGLANKEIGIMKDSFALQLMRISKQ